MPDEIPPSPPGLLYLLRVWTGIGLQSWGGGTATFALIQRSMTQTHPWLTDTEFTRLWAVAQLSPGINLIAFAILLGRRVGGRWGPLTALVGLLVPSVAVTLIITALYARVRDNGIVKSAFVGILPATVGIGLYTAARTARPLLQESHAAGWGALAFDLGLISFCVFLAGWVHMPTVAVVLGGATISGLVHWARNLRAGVSERRSD